MTTAAALPRASLLNTPEAITTALKDMLQSDGWALLCEMVNEQYGPAAFERSVALAMEQLDRPGDDKAERATVAQVIAGNRAAREVLTLPQAKIDAVNKPAAPDPKSLAARMAPHRDRVRW